MSVATDIQTAFTVAEGALDALGLDDLAGLAKVVDGFGQLVAKAIASKQVNAPVEIAAADIAADIAEDAKFGKVPSA
jgi:hypothetical protein